MSKRKKSDSDHFDFDLEDIFNEVFGDDGKKYDKILRAKTTDELADALEDIVDPALKRQHLNKNEQFRGDSCHDLSPDKIEQNDLPSPLSPSHIDTDVYIDPHTHNKPPTQKAKTTSSSPKGPVFTSVSQITSYLKVDRIQGEIKAPEPDWPIFAIKELGANCYDFFKVRYPNAPREQRKIAFRVRVDSSGILRINVRNSNANNVEVFKNLEQRFDYNRWGSEKRNQHNRQYWQYTDKR
jgi:hypothetical protein